MMKKTTKELLFERMQHLNPEFVYIKESEEIDERHLDVTNMPDITAKLKTPNVGTKKYSEIDIENDGIKVKDNEFKPHKKYDFVVLSDGTIVIGYGHFKLSGKAETIKAAGEIMLDDYGKIVYLSNDSGHYTPNQENLKDIESKFREMNLMNREYAVVHKKHNHDQF